MSHIDPALHTPTDVEATGASPTVVVPPAPESPRPPCLICRRTDSECLLRGDSAACYHRNGYGGIERTDKHGKTFYVCPVPPELLRRFMSAIFEPNDLVLLRQIEAWTDSMNKGHKKSAVNDDATKHIRASTIAQDMSHWAEECWIAEQKGGNQYFGVCPRADSAKKAREVEYSWDHAFQIRTVRTLWADIDHCTVAEVLDRCAKAGLPPPTAVVSSGNGVHLYWRLSEAYFIDDAGGSPPLRKVLQLQDDDTLRYVRYYLDASGKRVYAPFHLSDKALHLQRVLAGIAVSIGGDHTKDLSRLLRLPCTWNRKNQRNGAVPKPCELVDCDPSRRYPLSLFEAFVAPQGERRASKLTPVGGSPLAPRQADRTASAHVPAVVADISDAELIERAKKAKNGSQFVALWNGDTSRFNGNQSSADLALCGILAFWCGHDPARIDRLFRISALVRDKWLDRPDYRELTIEKALASTTAFWSPSRHEKYPEMSLSEMIEWADTVKPEVPTLAKQPLGDPETDQSSPPPPLPEVVPDSGADGFSTTAYSARDLRQECRKISELVLDTVSTPTEMPRGAGVHEKFPDRKPPNDIIRNELRRFLSARCVVDCDGRPCPARQWIQLGDKTTLARGMGLGVRCRRWSCVVCIKFQKALWQGHLWDILCDESRPLYFWRGTGRKWQTTQKAIERGHGEHCRVAMPRGRVLIVTTAAVKGAVPIGTQDAAETIVIGIDRIKQKNSKSGSKHERKGSSKRKPKTQNPVSSSRGWSLPETKTGTWFRLVFFKDPDRSLPVLRALGVRVKEQKDESGGKSADGIQRRASCLYPRLWNREHIRWGNEWAAAMTIPPGWREGDLPIDPTPLLDALMSATEEFFDGELPDPRVTVAPVETSRRPTVDSISTAAPLPAPLATTLWMRFALEQDAQLDPDGRWRIVARSPDGEVQRWSKRAYRTEEDARHALASGRFQMAADGVYPERVAYAPRTRSATPDGSSVDPLRSPLSFE